MQSALRQAVLSKNEEDIDLVEYYLALVERNILTSKKEL
jgi:hypothetical protein